MQEHGTDTASPSKRLITSLGAAQSEYVCLAIAGGAIICWLLPGSLRGKRGNGLKQLEVLQPAPYRPRSP